MEAVRETCKHQLTPMEAEHKVRPALQMANPRPRALLEAVQETYQSEQLTTVEAEHQARMQMELKELARQPVEREPIMNFLPQVHKWVTLMSGGFTRPSISLKSDWEIEGEGTAQVEALGIIPKALDDNVLRKATHLFRIFVSEFENNHSISDEDDTNSKEGSASSEGTGSDVPIASPELESFNAEGQEIHLISLKQLVLPLI